MVSTVPTGRNFVNVICSAVFGIYLGIMDRSDSTHGSYDGLVSVRCHRRKLSNVRWYGQLDKSQPRLVLFSTLGKQFCHEHFWILKMIRYTNKGQHIFTCDLREVQAEFCASLARDIF